MKYLINAVVGFVWMFLNLFLGYYCVISIGSPEMWDLPFINEKTLPFITYWGYLFVASIILCPFSASLALVYKIENEPKDYKFIIQNFITTFVTLCIWFSSWLFHFIKDWPIFN